MTVSTLNLQNIWEQHRSSLHDATHYAATSTTATAGSGSGGILYLPTAAGVASLGDRVALKTWFMAAGASPFDLALQWKEGIRDEDLQPIQIIKTMISGSEVMEEVVLTFCHDKVINWLLPGMAPTRKVIQLPMVLSVSYEGDKIQSLRVFWDQASVLKQIGTFADLTIAKATTLQGTLAAMPMVPASAACKALLLGEGLNPFMTETSQGIQSRPGSSRTMASASSIVPGDSASVASARPSIRLGSQGGFKHADNDIFGAAATPPKSASSASDGHIAANPARYRTHFSTATEGLAGQTPTAKGKKHFQANPNYTDSQDNTMSELGSDPGAEAFTRYKDNEGLKQRPSTASSIGRFRDHNASSFSLSGDYEESVYDDVVVVKKKTFGGLASMESGATASGEVDLGRTGKRTSGSKTASQIVIGGVGEGAEGKSGSDLHGNQRPSSRVLAPPGGGSSIMFG